MADFFFYKYIKTQNVAIQFFILKIVFVFQNENAIVFLYKYVYPLKLKN